MSKSQLGQDLAVVKFYKERKGGFFVEIGANDGVSLSNTFMLETVYGWKGICVEPVPKNYDKLIKSRPGSICRSDAVYSHSGLSVDFDIANDVDLLSGISTHIDHTAVVNANKTTIRVNTVSLFDLLINANAPNFIEYLSIDTEGSEYEILRTFDFTKYVFGLIDVEHNCIEPRRTNIRQLLLANGYKYIGPNKFDDMYVHTSLQ
uniref:Methyltransferase FkbM domain-containing protein n=1 Tax=viral metagenome TaxID=1070528 RepID=A0A6C0I856_9ZZZZ